MAFRIKKSLISLVVLFLTASPPNAVSAQWTPSNPDSSTRPAAGASPSERRVDINIEVNGADSGSIEGIAMVSLVSVTGQVLMRGTTVGGHIRFGGVPAGTYTIQVVAPGYESVATEFRGYAAGSPTIIIDMRPALNERTHSISSGILLAPKAQKELGKALEALRVKRPQQARSHLEAAYRKAPSHPAVNYLYGVYFLQLNDPEKAKFYWAKALEFDPKNVFALLSLSEASMRQQKFAEAETYVKRAVEASPNSWRAHAILAEVFLKEHFTKDSIKEADHALELGHGQAAIVQPLLARALAEEGRKDHAIRVLEGYVQGHPNDAAARKQLESMRTSEAVIPNSEEDVSAEIKPANATESAMAPPLPSNWLPPDVDENVPQVEPGVACALDEVLQNAGKRVEEFIRNVDRFAASELLRHESINKWGYADVPEIRKFDYLVSIEQYRPGYFDVIEYRSTKYSPTQFPEGVETRGLPSMALIFHPNNVGNFAMSCEGLGQWNGTPAWQVHFRQRPDKPKNIRAYRIGEGGPSYPVALRGRAWIAEDNYQIIRLETDLVSTLPEIRLFIDHTAVDYGPVQFKDRNVKMWLPQSAEVYSDWRGKRMHRRHSFSNYILFSVDERQHISEPKGETKSQTEN